MHEARDAGNRISCTLRNLHFSRANVSPFPVRLHLRKHLQVWHGHWMALVWATPCSNHGSSLWRPHGSHTLRSGSTSPRFKFESSQLALERGGWTFIRAKRRDRCEHVERDRSFLISRGRPRTTHSQSRISFKFSSGYFIRYLKHCFQHIWYSNLLSVSIGRVFTCFASHVARSRATLEATVPCFCEVG